MDIKARSKAMREILTRLRERAKGAIEVKVFGDKVILDEGPFVSGNTSSPLVIALRKMSKTGPDATFSFPFFQRISRLTRLFPTLNSGNLSVSTISCPRHCYGIVVWLVPFLIIFAYPPPAALKCHVMEDPRSTLS